jgi:hypothetical protein
MNRRGCWQQYYCITRFAAAEAARGQRLYMASCRDMPLSVIIL